MHKLRSICEQWQFDDFRRGTHELFWMLFFGVMPLWVGWLFVRTYGATFAAKYFHEFINGGDLLLISVALVGPLMYPLLRQYGKKDISTTPFPLNVIFIIVIFLLTIISTGSFYELKLMNSDIFPKHDDMPIDHDYTSTVSYISFISAIAIAFSINSLRNLMDHWDIPREFRSNTNELLKEWDK